MASRWWKSLMTRWAISVQYSVWQTDGQTDIMRQHSPRYLVLKQCRRRAARRHSVQHIALADASDSAALQAGLQAGFNAVLYNFIWLRRQYYSAAEALRYRLVPSSQFTHTSVSCNCSVICRGGAPIGAGGRGGVMTPPTFRGKGGRGHNLGIIH